MSECCEPLGGAVIAEARTTRMLVPPLPQSGAATVLSGRGSRRGGPTQPGSVGGSP
jgi:hypothetical protein